MKQMLWTFQFVFGCHHSQLSRVFTIKRRTYKVCIKCGREFEYSWARMRTLQPNAADYAYTTRDSARHIEVSIL
jgi:hypothetical protein